MMLAIASGKGGTGKTTVAVNLARTLGENVQLLDCDVEAPNAHLFLNGVPVEEETASVLVPSLNKELCNNCGECARFCAYHAIAAVGSEPLFFTELCHSCGGCAKGCPQNAIEEVSKRVGVVQTFRSGPITLIQGRLDIGVPMASPLIHAVKERRQEDVLSIVDAPPGTACSAIAALQDADFAVLVTEPTPFGLHDLKLAVEMIRKLGVPLGVVINRSGAGDARAHAYCAGEGIPILMEIPDDRRIAEAYSEGKLIVEALPEYRGLFEQLLEKTTHFACTPADSKDIGS